jgi:protein-S-isoprenylcysteine O-methyltransferase Ste14
MVFRALIGLVFTGLVLLVSRYRRQAQAGESYELDQEGWTIVVPLRLVGLALWLYLPLYVLFPRLMAWSTVPLPNPLRWAGLAVAGLLVPPFVHWAQSNLGDNVTTTVITKEGHQLVTEGPYRCIRHPLYTSGFIFFLAMSLAMGSWLLLLAISIVAISLLKRTPKEEAQLIERFGDQYREYIKRTGRFIPRFGENR